MFGLGIWEILVIFLVAIVFINPKDLPKIARKIGYVYGKYRKVLQTINAELKDLAVEIKNPIEDIKNEVNKPIDSIAKDISPSGFEEKET
jgi:Tat protein translocase TatB subunit